MAQPKLPNNLDIEELLKVVSESKEQSTIFDNLDIYGLPEDVKKFILIFNIKPGTDPIPIKLIHRVYKAWGGSIVEPSRFGLHLSKYIQTNRGIYHINKSLFKLNDDIIEKLKGSNQTKSSKYRKYFERFLKENGLSKGRSFVFWGYVFKLQQNWAKSLNKRPIGKQQFYKFCKIYFDVKYNKRDKRTYIGINNKLEVLLTKEILEGIKKEVRSENKFYKIKEEKQEKTKETGNQEIEKQTSLPPTGTESKD